MLGNSGGYRFSGYSSMGNGNSDPRLYAQIAKMIEIAIAEVQTTQLIFLSVFIFAFLVGILVINDNKYKIYRSGSSPTY